MSRFNYLRRNTCEVNVGGVTLGASNPIRLQSMTNCSTLDTDACVEQTLRIVGAGGDIVRLTTQGEREATNMAEIRNRLREAGCMVPLVADVHYNPKAAYVAARCTDKVRINPGNFTDPARTFKKLEYTDEEYAAEIEKIRKAFVPFLDICREHHTAVRLGVNHGSLSDRIMSRYGDSPAGMVESVMEYLRICRDEQFNDVVISVKASNTTVMVETVRMLVCEMDRENMDFPLHLGVTEAGDGEDGRIKSAVGIGALLAEGIGDTIRVSLSEPPEAEVPVARMLRDRIVTRQGHVPVVEPSELVPFPARSLSLPLPGAENISGPLLYEYDFQTIPAEWQEVDAASRPEDIADGRPLVLVSRNVNAVGEMQSFIERLLASGRKNAIVAKLSYPHASVEELQIYAAADFGTLLLNGYCSAIIVDAPRVSSEERVRIGLGILQAARLRITKTEFISCPGCGRTLFDLQSTLHKVREATGHLTGLKIGVMGCIVNGPGEMADADYGYVGAWPGRISLYKGKECIERNIPQEEAIEHLVELIKSCGDWKEPD